MNILNKEEFKNLLRETIQTASEVEMTSHLGYDKYQESSNPNYRNGTNLVLALSSRKKHYMVKLMFQYPEIEMEHFSCTSFATAS